MNLSHFAPLRLRVKTTKTRLLSITCCLSIRLPFSVSPRLRGCILIARRGIELELNRPRDAVKWSIVPTIQFTPYNFFVPFVFE